MTLQPALIYKFGDFNDDSDATALLYLGQDHHTENARPPTHLIRRGSRRYAR